MHKTMRKCEFLLVALAAFSMLATSQAEYNITTDPVRQPGNNRVYIDVSIEDYVAIFCKITTSNGTPVDVKWTLTNGTNTSYLNFTNTPQFGLGIQLSDNSSLFNLTIQSNAISTMISLTCSAGDVNETFAIGNRVDPELSSGIENRVEGTTFTISLLIDDAMMPFPPVVSSVWSRNGQNITDGNIKTMGYNITFCNVTRQQSGVYVQTVSNIVSNVVGNFTLDILYPPEGVDGEQVLYALLGQAVHLVALTNITANPTMNFSIWTNTSDQPIMLNESQRYTEPRIGELIIKNATHNDNGTYGFAMTNGVSTNGHVVDVFELINSIMNGNLSANESNDFFLTKQLELNFAVPPGPPINLTLVSDTNTSVTLMWEEPLEPGVPEISYYVYILGVIVKTTNDTFITIDKLTPATQYNITVVGTNSFFNGSEVASILVSTSAGVPQVTIIDAKVSGRMLILLWTISHTANETIQINAGCANEYDLRNNDVPLRYSCNQSCIDNNLMGNTVLSPKYAGVYQCRVSTANGAEKILDNIIVPKGIPSVPIVSEGMSTTTEIVIMVRIQYPGVIESDSLSLKLVAIDVNGSVSQNNYSLQNYTSNDTYTVMIKLNSGVYNITITSENMYGESHPIHLQVDTSNVTPTPPATTGSSVVLNTESFVVMMMAIMVIVLI